MAVLVDTLKVARTLKAAGLNDQQAEGIADALRDGLSTADLVTKADLREALAALKTDVIKWVVGLSIAQMALLVGILARLL